VSELKSLAIRWFEEVWNQERTETIDELLPDDGVIYDSGRAITGPREFHAYYDNLQAMFDGIRVHIDQAIAEDDTVSLRWISTMKDKASAKALHVTGMSMVRFKDGRICEAWQNWDQYGLMDQLACASRGQSFHA
jgi:predicted SnoaL-like aldol condensation-catalyzing enzyme